MNFAKQHPFWTALIVIGVIALLIYLYLRNKNTAATISQSSTTVGTSSSGTSASDTFRQYPIQYPIQYPVNNNGINNPGGTAIPTGGPRGGSSGVAMRVSGGGGVKQ